MIDFKSEMRGLLSVLSAKSALIMANPMYKEKGQHCNRQIEKTLSSLLALIEKRLPKEKEVTIYKQCSLCGDRWINEEDKGFNQCLSEIRSQFK